MSHAAQDLLSLAPPSQAAALLAFMVNPTSARDRSAWLELQGDMSDAQAVFDAVQALPHEERLPVWEKLAEALSRAPLETRQELVSDARELLRVGGRVSMLRKLLWVCQRHLLNGQPATARSAPGANATLPQRLDVTHALAVCCFTAWISDTVPQPELTLDLSEATSLNDRWWQAVTAPWREQHDDKDLRLPRRDKVDADLALRSLHVLQNLPPDHAAGVLENWLDAAYEVLPPDTPLHPVAADVLRLTANLLKVGMPRKLIALYADEPPPVTESAVDAEQLAHESGVPDIEPTIEAELDKAYAEPLHAPQPEPLPTPVLVSPPPPAEPPLVSPMERPFSAVTRPPDVAFVFKAALLHLPGDPDYPPSDSTNSPADESTPPSR